MAGWSKELPKTRVALALCQNADAVASFFDFDPTPYTVLVDESRDVARAYGVYHLLGFDAINIARPSTFVIDRERVVRFVFVAGVQWEQPEEGLLREAIEAAGGV